MSVEGNLTLKRAALSVSGGYFFYSCRGIFEILVTKTVPGAVDLDERSDVVLTSIYTKKVDFAGYKFSFWSTPTLFGLEGLT